MGSPVQLVCNIVWHAKFVAPQTSKLIEKRAGAYEWLRNRSHQLRSFLICKTDGHTFCKKPHSQRAFLSYSSREDEVDKHEGQRFT